MWPPSWMLLSLKILCFVYFTNKTLFRLHVWDSAPSMLNGNPIDYFWCHKRSLKLCQSREIPVSKLGKSIFEIPTIFASRPWTSPSIQVLQLSVTKELLENHKFANYFELKVKILKVICFLIFCERRKSQTGKILKTKFSSKKRHWLSFILTNYATKTSQSFLKVELG